MRYVDRVTDWQQWRRPGPTREQQRWDVGAAAVIGVGAVVAVVLVNSMGAFAFGSAPSLTEQLLWCGALAAPLAVRRRYPVAVLLVGATIFVAAQARQLGDNFVLSLSLFVAIYTVGAWGRDRLVARWVRIGVIAVMFGWLGFTMAQQLAGPPIEFEQAAGPLDPLLAAAIYTVAFNLLFFLSAYWFGTAAWVSARRQHELWVQGERLRQSQAENARQAVVAERLRIARDLHDVVAHHVSVMGVQAAAARRVLDRDRAQASTSLAVVEQTARTAISELRGLLGVLRAEPATTEADSAADTGRGGAGRDDGHRAAPGLEQIPDLVAEVRNTSGIEASYATYGEPVEVPEAVGLSAYRVVQEALTNTVKHSGASTAEVRVRRLEHHLEVEVGDDGIGASTAMLARARGSDTHAHGGYGLLGMRERVAVHAGELEVEPRRSGGLLIRARFPLATSETTSEAGTDLKAVK